MLAMRPGSPLGVLGYRPELTLTRIQTSSSIEPGEYSSLFPGGASEWMVLSSRKALAVQGED